MSDWKKLTAVALLGTGRAAPDLALPSEVAALAPEPDEAQVLRVAGLLALVQSTVPATAPSQDAPFSEPAPAEIAKVATRAELLTLLREILASGNLLLISEACQLLAKRGQVLAPELLPLALEYARRHKIVRPVIEPVIGKRGAWLATLNPDWKFSATADADTSDAAIWEIGAHPQRLEYLGQLRRANPAEALDLLKGAFPKESAADRAAMVGALADTLTPTDEPFLNELLADDRSKEVRGQVTPLLGRLPGSAYAQRMAARLASCVKFEKKLLGKSTLRIEPPAEFGADWAADLIEEKPPGQIGKRAWWLRQLVAATPLNWWKDTLGLAPAEALAQIGKTDWKSDVREALRQAIQRQPGHHEWTQALLDLGGFPFSEAITLAVRLPEPARQATLAKILTRESDCTVLTQVISATDEEWGAPLWQVVWQQLPTWMGRDDWRFRDTLTKLACRVPVSELHREFTFPDIPLFSEAIAEFLRTIEQRRALHKFIV